MAAGAKATPTGNGTASSAKTIELAISLPHNPTTSLHIRLDISSARVMLFLTSASMESGQGGNALGSFVYSIPDRYYPTQPMSTALYTVPHTIDFTTRLAKVLARKAKRPCYVGSSVDLANTAGGGTVEEEMEAFKAVVDVVVMGLERADVVEEEEEDGEDEG